jgi:hypothetical protein
MQHFSLSLVYSTSIKVRRVFQSLNAYMHVLGKLESADTGVVVFLVAKDQHASTRCQKST